MYNNNVDYLQPCGQGRGKKLLLLNIKVFYHIAIQTFYVRSFDIESNIVCTTWMVHETNNFLI